MAAMEDLEDDIEDFIKMELDIENEDFVGWSLEESIYDDPLLTLKPFVYTTKLDEMNTVTQDLTDFTAEEIIKKLESENTPKVSFENMQPPSTSTNIESFQKLTNIVSLINLKANQQKEKRNIKNKTIMQTIPVKNKVAIQKTWQDRTLLIGSSGAISEVRVKLEPIDSFLNEMKAKQVEKQNITPNNEISEAQKDNVTIAITDSDSNESTVTSANLSEVIKTKEKTKQNMLRAKFNKNKKQRIETESSSKNKIRKSLRQVDLESSDDDTALIHLKRKVVTNVPTQRSSLEKFTLIVLLHENNAFVYRANVTKLITDYFITDEYDEYKLATMYPKEEKIIEHYCCWLKREEVVTKICMRKNYPFEIQKFLRLPHSCHPENCRCCCYNNKASNQNKVALTERRGAVNKAFAVADIWIRSLLNRNQLPTGTLISKALSYILKPQAKERRALEESEDYAEFLLLCIKYSGPNRTCFKNVAELYQIGKNGSVVRSFLLKKDANERQIRNMYHNIGIQCMEKNYCCWYAREKLMHNLRLTKISPTALKLIQMPHKCEMKHCTCCCKTQPVLLQAIPILPTNIKYTTAYERNIRQLTIRFNDKSKTPIEQSESYYKSNTIQNCTNASPAATVLSNCAFKEHNVKLSISILSKFKNLKLGVTSDGKLETILNAPARNLSIPELKILSDILAFSTKQIVELGLSPQEFCNRINSKSGQPNSIELAPSEVSPASEPEIVPMSPIQLNDDTNEKIATVGNIVSRSSQSKLSTPPLTPLQTQNKPIIQKVSKRTTTSTKSNCGKSIANTYSSMSNLMETKNKNYVNSFKSFFENKVPSNIAIPEITKFPLISGLSKEQVSGLCLPKIAKTFTLASLPTSSNKAPDIALAGPSGITQSTQTECPARTEPKLLGISNPSKAILSKNVNPESLLASNINKSPMMAMAPIRTYDASNPKHEALISNHTNVDKRLRIVNPSEPKKTETESLKIIPIARRPASGIMKQDMHINTNSNLNPPTTLNPISQTQTYVVDSNKDVTSPNPEDVINTSITINNTLYHVNSNSIRNTSNTGLRFLTLTPITPNVDKSMLAQILDTPQVQPSVNGLPPLVPLRSANIVPVTIKSSSSFQDTFEKSCGLLDNTEK